MEKSIKFGNGKGTSCMIKVHNHTKNELVAATLSVKISVML